ncbi:hypothetical protein AB835_09650 [Candidatus Endobugula sertula]|uniref:Uncharacterized protein n=1 Tax=Candidatus Endobugula sertula TaxID=62101 RepID=A0A1D2QNW9_9GAMM|nr:hypothetical protein AB835_09650 [Candidatus Endobugula sertula]
MIPLAVARGGDCKNDPENDCSTGSPVYLATGKFNWSETDIVLKGRPQLAVTRTFNSHDPRIGLLGNGWTTSCDQGLVYTVRYENNAGVITEVAEYVRRLANGKRYIYRQQADGSFVGPGLFDVVTRQVDGMARLQKRDGSYTIYRESGQLQTKADRHGNLIHYDYGLDDRLIRQKDTHGRIISYYYNSNGLVSRITDHSGREWTYTYDSRANLTGVTDPLGNTRHYEYQTYQPSGDGNVYSQLTGITDGSGVVEISVTYNGSRVSSYTDLENTYHYTFDTNRRLATKVDSQGSSWRYHYNATGQRSRTEAPVGRTTTYGRNSHSLLTRLTDPSGTIYEYTYDQYSNRLTASDARGKVTTIYDGAKPWPLTVTSRSGRVTTITYDSYGRPLIIKDPENNNHQLQWSPHGDLLSVTNALGHQTRISYNNQGMPLTVTDALGRTTQYQYDKVNNVIRITNPAGETTHYTYDAQDRLIAYTDGNGDVTSYQYDQAHRVTEITNANQQRVRYQYDNFGRLQQRRFYDDTIFSYTYRNDNLINTMTRPDGIVTTYSYDAAKRLTQRKVGDEETYTYTYNLRDELTSVTNNTGTVDVSYDDFGRTLAMTVNGQQHQYQYNTENEPTQLNSLGVLQTQQYNQRGLLTQMAANSNTYQYTYDSINRLTALTRSDITPSTYTYDSANQLTDIHHGLGQRSHRYQYDLASRLSQWQGVSDETRDYTYDRTGRLTQTQSSNTSADENYTYDALGNRQQHNAQLDVANRLIENDYHQYTYDINGNRTTVTNKLTGAIERYQYNSLDQMIGYQRYTDIQPDTVASVDYSYTYGPLGRRWSKTNNITNSITTFHWSGSALIGEVTNGTTRRYLIEGSTPVGFIENGNIYHYLKDHLGTAHQIIDSSGVVVWEGNYDSFGNATETVALIENNLRFAGQYFDQESGLHYNYFRYYDPKTGRYTQSDPIGLDDGPNSYSYVYNNPLVYFDPDGRSAVGVVGGWIGTDVAVPDPSDAAWPKWAGYGIALGVGVGSLLASLCENDDCEKKQ